MAALLATTVLSFPVWGTTGNALAQTGAKTSFDIPAGPLGAALAAFGLQSGTQVSYDASIVFGKTSSGVHGALSHEETIARILQGSGLHYSFDDDSRVLISESGVHISEQTAEDGSSLLETIIVSDTERGSEDEEAPFNTPGSDAHISQEQINRVPPSAPGDIFRTVPGVFSSASNDGNSLNINIRGAQGLNRVRTMVEGTQQETTGNRGYAGSDQRSYVDPAFIGDVEVSKGPGTGPYGSGTTSGVVNVRLLDAGDLVPEGSNNAIRLLGGISGNAIAPTCDENNTGPECGLRRRGADGGLRPDDGQVFSDDNWFGSIAAAHQSENFEFVAAYARRTEGNYFAGKNGEETFQARNYSGVPREHPYSYIEPGQEVPNTSEETESLLLKGTVLFGDGHSINTGFTYYESQFGMAFPTNLVTFEPSQTTLNDVESGRGWLRYNWESDNNLINFNANVWGTHIREKGELRQAPQKNASWGAEIWNTSIVDTGIGELTMTYGGEYSRSDGIIDLDVPLNRTDYAVGLPPVVTNNGFAPDFDGTREVFGGHFNAALSPTDWLTLSAGMRYDRFDGTSTTITGRREVGFDNAAFLAEMARLENALFDAEDACDSLWPDTAAIDACYVANVFPALNELNNIWSRTNEFRTGFEETFTQQNESSTDRLSPNFGVTLEPLDGVQLFALYAEGFRALSLVELGQSYAFGTSFDPFLEPEILKTWEFGMNYLDNDVFLAGDALRFKLVYFDNDYENFIARPYIGAPFTNIDEVSISGMETTVAYDAGRVFVDLNLSYYTEIPSNIGTVVSSLRQPRYSGTLTAGTRWFDERLELGGRLTFFDERQPDVGDELTLSDVPRYWQSNAIVDVFGSYNLNENTSLNFSVENVTDEYYLPPLFVNRMPAPGRTFRVGFTTAFDF